MTHSPAPWEQWIGPDLGRPWKYGRTVAVNVPGLGQMAIASTDFHTEELGSANAAHIVKCVNAHDDLVKALSHLVHWHDQLSAKDIAMAKEALAKAGVSA